MKGRSPGKNVRTAVIALSAIALLCPAAGEAVSANAHGIPHAVASEEEVQEVREELQGEVKAAVPEEGPRSGAVRLRPR